MRTFVVASRGVLEGQMALLKFKLLRCSENFALWGNEQEGRSEEAADFFRKAGFLRVFESCFVIELEESKSRTEAIQLLFLELAGDTYNTAIDMRRNVECYNTLYLRARKLAAREFAKVLDFGCGPGTILASGLYSQFDELFGYDLVQENREHASSLGLKVLQPNEVENLPEHFFDLVVCTYVLHYKSVEQRVLNSLITSLKLGGVLAANFHKSTGIEWFLDCLRDVSNVRLERDNSVFGELVFIVKGSSDGIL